MCNIRINNIELNFELTDLEFGPTNIEDVFCNRLNINLEELINRTIIPQFDINQYEEYRESPIGQFLCDLKHNNDNTYLQFLNRYGDERYCKFSITNNHNDKGLYCFIVDGKPKYIGRTLTNFHDIINNGCGKITPANCYNDGQLTNCRINSGINEAINNDLKVKLGIYKMNESSNADIINLKRDILRKYHNFDWNNKE